MTDEVIPKFNDRNGIEGFLKTKDKSWSLVIASRIALRVLASVDLENLRRKLKNSTSHVFLQPYIFDITSLFLLSTNVSCSAPRFYGVDFG
jgi:hypothetical protein